MAEPINSTSKRIEKLLEETNALLEENIQKVNEQTRVVKEIDDKVRKVVINTSD